MKTTKGSLRGSILAMGLVAALAAAASVTASAVGRVGYSGNPATGGGQTCTVCHGGGAAPTVAFHGPTTVVPGVANVYSFVLQSGPTITGGLDVSATAGVLHPGSGMRSEGGEVTHTFPRDFDLDDSAAFTFTWTAPAAPATVTLYGAGVSSDGTFNTDGDGVATTTLGVTVANTAQSPSKVALTQIDTLAKVTDITHAGDSRLFIVEQPGRIWIYKPGVGRLATPFLDISGPVDDVGNEKGLLGLAFHPSYTANGYFYVNYTVASPQRTRVTRFQVSAGNPDVANAASELILLEFSQPYTNHNGGASALRARWLSLHRLRRRRQRQRPGGIQPEQAEPAG